MISRLKRLYRRYFPAQQSPVAHVERINDTAPLEPLITASTAVVVDEGRIQARSSEKGRFFVSCRRSSSSLYSPGEEISGRVIRATVNGLDILLPNGEVGFVVKQEISWLGNHIEYKPGANVNVVVLSFKPGFALFLSIRRFQHDQQFKAFINRLTVGDTLCGHVKTIKDYGVFVAIGPGVDALLHRSAVANMGIFTRQQLGKPITVKVVKIDIETNRVQLSLVEFSPY